MTLTSFPFSRSCQSSLLHQKALLTLFTDYCRSQYYYTMKSCFLAGKVLLAALPQNSMTFSVACRPHIFFSDTLRTHTHTQIILTLSLRLKLPNVKKGFSRRILLDSLFPWRVQDIMRFLCLFALSHFLYSSSSSSQLPDTHIHKKEAETPEKL